MLIRDHVGVLTEGLEQLARAAGLAPSRLGALDEGAEPTLDEVGRIAEALALDPIHLFRPSPLVVAQRAGTTLGGELRRLLIEFDLHIAAYRADLPQDLQEAFPATKAVAARRHGEGWASRNNVRAYELGSDFDPLIDAIERQHAIPVLVWPIPEGPFGLVADFQGVLGMWVNSHNKTGLHQRFTIAHELGHVLLRHVSGVRPETHVDVTAPQRATPASRSHEYRANDFASGVFADYEALRARWTFDSSAAAVARLAVEIGASYKATLYLLRHHKLLTRAELQRLETVSVRQAFSDADLAHLYTDFVGDRNRARIPAILPEQDLLRLRLERVLGGPQVGVPS